MTPRLLSDGEVEKEFSLLDADQSENVRGWRHVCIERLRSHIAALEQIVRDAPHGNDIIDLMSFYSVDTIPELIKAQAHHVESMQQTLREGTTAAQEQQSGRPPMVRG